jgi:hypothetical protein
MQSFAIFIPQRHLANLAQHLILTSADFPVLFFLKYTWSGCVRFNSTKVNNSPTTETPRPGSYSYLYNVMQKNHPGLSVERTKKC